MALGMAGIVSPVGVNTRIIRHGENGLIAETTAEWENAIRLLLSDEALRKEFGRHAALAIQQQWSVDAWKDTYLKLFQ